MCKFCDSNKEKSILSYDNHDSMNVCCGQYQGVSISADISMKGNMLILASSGSYRSRLDCYYEDEGLDCDSEYSENAPSSYIKIEYCPFCGKKIESNVFEKQKTEDEIDVLKYKLEKAKEKLATAGLRVYFSFVAKGDLYEKASEMVWQDYTGNCKILPIKLDTILEEFGNLNAKIIYGGSNDKYIFGSSHSYPPFNPEEGVKFSGSSFSEFHGATEYSLTEEQYDMLVNMGLVKRNIIKLNGVKSKQEKYNKMVQDISNELSKLKKKLKQYKNGK